MRFKVTTKDPKDKTRAKVLTRVLNAQLKDPDDRMMSAMVGAIQTEFEASMMSDIVGHGWMKAGQKGRGR